MNKTPELSEHVRRRTKEWFRKAEHELKFLEHAPFDVEDPPTDTACRLAHMAAEYSLKGYLMLNKKKIRKIHELGDLLDDCIAIRQDKTFEALRDDCVVLTKYKLELTYPDHIPQVVSLEEAKAAIEKARRIKNFVLEKSKEFGY